MTAARADESGSIPSREWKDADSHSFRVLPTNPGDECVIATVYDRRRDSRADVAYSAEQLREMAADFIERAEHLDNVAGRNRKTPAWHIREGERLLSQAKQHPESSGADVIALIASAHFQAAQALRSGHTQVVNNHYHPIPNPPSGKDTE